MNSGIKATRDAAETGNDEACPLDSPLTGRFPGVLSLLAIPGAVFLNPLFFGLAGGLLGVISVLLSPPRCRLLGSAGMLGAVVVLVLARI